MKKKHLTFILMASMYACAPSAALFQPTEADVQRVTQNGAKTDLATLDQGYHLYQQHCGSCHSLQAPPRRTMEQWNKILPQMFPKTKMSEQEKGLVRQYIEARR